MVRLPEADRPGAEGVPGSCQDFSSKSCLECVGDAQSGHAPWKGTTTGGCCCWTAEEGLLLEAPSALPVVARLAGAGLLRWLPGAGADWDTSWPALQLLIGCSTWRSIHSIGLLRLWPACMTCQPPCCFMQHHHRRARA